MIIQAFVISGSVWIGKRIYAELTKSPAQADAKSRSVSRDVAVREEPISEREKESSRNLAIGVSGLTLAIGGAVAAPVLSLFSMPVLWAALPHVREGFLELRRDHRINYGLFVTGMTAGCMIAGYFVLTALGVVVYCGSEVMVDRTRRRTRKSLEGMFEDSPGVAWVRSGEVEISVDLVDLSPGDIVVARAGEPIPVDGTVVAGAGGVDQSVITGESVVAERTIGDRVFASTLLLSGTLDIRVEQAGNETLAGQVAEVLSEMDSFESSVEHRSVRVADASVMPAMALTAIGWVVRGPLGALSVAASNFADTDRLTSPMSTMNYMHVTAKAGIHIKDGRSLQLLGEVDTIVFDKTGTLTVDRLSVVGVQAADGWDNDEVLAICAGAEERQQHPIAMAIREAAEAMGLRIPAGITDTSSLGNGILSQVEGRRILVGSPRYFKHEGISIPTQIENQSLEALSEGKTVIHIASDEQWIGQITLQSSIRPEVAAMIAAFHADGYKTAILSGDHEGPTRRLAEALGIDMWRAGVLPNEKANFIEKLQGKGRSVCFVGDGINDGMALKAAHVSVSLNGASLVATDSAQIVLQQTSLANLRMLFDLSRCYRRDQKLMQGSMMLTSVLAAGGALFLHVSLISIYSMYFATLATGSVIAASPLFRRLDLPAEPIAKIEVDHCHQLKRSTS
ncbi:heavy metal translocating P-type ATPase [Planctomycetes bacterium K23_9]|uniref:P-type Zn(2+) transporter n=1 Tax=Stieleria marina TaxID=1930275 RepID=A0A517P0K6_9BACT|nr:Copper-transporting P-type ATPase [Planctomycetes bacterium K23_9]